MSEKADSDEDRIPEYVVVKDVLDLHGFFPEQVPEVVDEFVRSALEQGFRSVQIIHGKGKSKLKYLVREQLENNPHVLEYRDAPPELGGWGRTVVSLAPPPDAGRS